MVNFLFFFSVGLALAYILYLLRQAPRQGVAAWALAGGLAACVALEACDWLALRGENSTAWLFGGLVAQALLPPLWLLFALSFAREGGLRKISWLHRLLLLLSPFFLLAVLFFPLDRFFFYPDFPEEKILFLGQAGYLFSIGLLLYLTAILVQLERTLAQLPRHARWRGKFELVGAGALLAILLVYFSQGLLHRTLDLGLIPARAFALAAGVALMAYSRLRRGEATRIRVSRDIAFRSVVVLAVGVYLIGLGLLGEGMRYLSVNSQRSFLIFVGLLGGVGVVVALLSEGLRRKVRVFLQKNFYENKYDYREQWQRFTRQISVAKRPDELYQGILLFFAETFAVRHSLLLLRDQESGVYRLTASYGLAPRDEVFAAANPLVRSLEERNWVFASRDRNPEVWAANRTFLERYDVSFIVPLLFDRTLEGFVVLGSSINRREEYSFEDFDLMKMLALQAASTILSVRLASQLTAAREMAAMGKVAAFVLHDLKNLASGLAMMVDNAREYIRNPEFQQDMLQTVEASVGKMKSLVARLGNLEESRLQGVEFLDLRQVVEEGARLAGSDRVQVDGRSVAIQGDRGELQKVALNLILNALEAGQGGGVRVEVGAGGLPCFQVRDAGCGMSEEFIRQRLFRPFETTKPEGAGIGLYQCRNIVEAHGGKIEVESREGGGSTFTVRLPPPVRPESMTSALNLTGE